MYEPKSYSQIKNELQKLDLLETVRTEIVVCVWNSLNENVKNNIFELLCGAVFSCWDKSENNLNIQLTADIVVDLYQNCEYGYRNPEKKVKVFCEEGKVEIPYIFTEEDLKDFSYKHRWLVYLLLSERG